MKKLDIALIIFTLLLTVSISTNVFAEEQTDEKEVVLTAENGDDIALYDNVDDESAKASISDGTTAILLEEQDHFSFIRVEMEDSSLEEGYVSNQHIVITEEPKQEEVNQEANEQANTNKSDEAEEQETEQIEAASESTIKSAKADKVVTGIALKEKTYVYQSKSTNSKQLKYYKKGSSIKYTLVSDHWYEATIKLNGKWVKGYFNAKDVDHSGKNNIVLNGYAAKAPTKVYKTAADQSTVASAEVLKTYPAGSKLKFRTYNGSYYIATVYLKGIAHTGYIHKDDVSSSIPTLQGFAQHEVTGVYASTSKGSKMLKSYPAGKVLKFHEYNSSWYETTVYVSGKAYTGYIYKEDVGDNKPTIKGYAQMEVTAVYDKASTTSNVLKSYSAGSSLIVRPYSADWYAATVYISGKAHNGFIRKDHVGDSMPLLTGFANNTSTAVYSQTARGSKVLKTYNKGHLLKYRPYNDSWYAATVFINGKAQKGYIHHNDVVQPIGKTVVIDAGHGGSDPGASANGIREKDLTLDLSLKTMKSLEQAGFQVIMTRTTDEFLQLKERTDIGNKSNAHLFLSIHGNSGGGTGIETYWYSKGPKPTESKELAGSIQSEVIKETGAPNRGVKEKNLHINRESNLPSALVEVGFLDHKNDSAKLKQESYKNSIVKGIVNGIKSYFKMPF